MPKLPETKRKAVGWVIVALLINVASIGVGFGIYDGRWSCLWLAIAAIFIAGMTAWRLS